MIDLFLSIILWIIFSPLMLLIAILIKLSDGGEIFLGTPTRLGLYGRPFFMFKFRTMVMDAHLLTMKSKHEREKLFKNHKIYNDVRVTKLGRILRGIDLDELPQLINIILGNMSMVGPRPYYLDEIEHHLKKYPEDILYINNIMKGKPGLTGIWQVSGRNKISFRKRLKMESEYVLKPSILKDIYILIKTPFVVLTRKGVKDKNV